MKNILILLTIVTTMASIAGAQTYSHKRLVVSAGGGSASVAGLNNRSAIAQTVVGIVTDDIFTNNAGFFFDFNLFTGLTEEEQLPLKFELSQNYPNPFNPSTTIKYTIAEQSHVRLEIYNILGQRLAVIIDENKEAGSHSEIWHADNIPSGVYFYRIISGDFINTKKMMLLK